MKRRRTEPSDSHQIAQQRHIIEQHKGDAQTSNARETWAITAYITPGPITSFTHTHSYPSLSTGHRSSHAPAITLSRTAAFLHLFLFTSG